MALLFAGGVLVLLGALLSLSRDQILRVYGRLLIVFWLIFGGLAFSFGCALGGDDAHGGRGDLGATQLISYRTSEK